MSIESAVAAVMVSNVGIHAIAADRIYPVVAPQDVDGPFIVYERLPFEFAYTQEGLDALQMARFRITTGSARFSDVVASTEAILAAFKGNGIGDNSVYICGCFADQPDDGYLIESGIHSRSVDIDIQFLTGN